MLPLLVLTFGTRHGPADYSAGERRRDHNTQRDTTVPCCAAAHRTARPNQDCPEDSWPSHNIRRNTKCSTVLLQTLEHHALLDEVEHHAEGGALRVKPTARMLPLQVRTFGTRCGPADCSTGERRRDHNTQRDTTVPRCAAAHRTARPNQDCPEDSWPSHNARRNTECSTVLLSFFGGLSKRSVSGCGANSNSNNC